MFQADGLTDFLDSRSFASIWYWLVVTGVWSLAGRNVLSVPLEVFIRARHDVRQDKPEGDAMIALFDWLSLILPHWQMRPRELVLYLALGAFALTSLIILGFAYDLELARALAVLLLPLAALFGMRMRAARQLTDLMASLQSGEKQAQDIADKVIRILVWHRRQVTLLSVLSVTVAAMVGVLWVLHHPNGM